MINHAEDKIHVEETAGRRILVVDDDRDFAEGLVDLLKPRGYILKTAFSAKGSRQTIKRFDAEVALIDLRLGRDSGIDLIGSLKKTRPDIICVIITAYAAADTAIDALQQGAYDYMRKPLDPRELFATLDRCLDKLRLEREKAEAEMALKRRNRELEEVNLRLRRVVKSVKGLATCSGSGEITSSLLHEFTENMAADKGCLYLFENGSLVLDHKLNAVEAPDTIPLPLRNGGIFDRTITEREPVLIEEMGEEDFTLTGAWKGFNEGSALVFPLPDEEGEIRGLIALNKRTMPPFCARDMELGLILTSYGYETLRTAKATEALLDGERKYRAIIENTGTAIVIIEEDMTISFANERLEDLTGYSKEEMEGKMSLVTFLHPEDLERIKGYHNQRRAEGKPAPETYEFRIVDRHETIKDMISSVHLIPGTKKSIGSLLDITERRRAEEERARIEAQLRQAQKMEAIGILAGGVAHDFNNLLTSIQGNAELAMIKSDEANLLYPHLKRIQRSSIRASDLTRQLLMFSRRQPMERVPLNLSRTIKNLLKMLDRLIGEDITIDVSCEPEPLTVKADEGNIEQVLMNLSVNARDAMPDGGTLSISARNVVLDKEDITEEADARPGRFVCLSVADTGMGMDGETARRVFEPFFTTKGLGHGTGLGLSVVYGIIQQHEGWVKVFSEPGRGSIFTVYIPAVSVKANGFEEGLISTEGLQGNGERVLLIEDEEFVREFAAGVLRENGYQVLEGGSARQGLDIFEREKGDFQLIFSDVVLPDQSGIQLVDQLMEMKSELRILLSSGYTDEKSRRKILTERGFPFLQKPYSLNGLLEIVKDVLK